MTDHLEVNGKFLPKEEPQFMKIEQTEIPPVQLPPVPQADAELMDELDKATKSKKKRKQKSKAKSEREGCGCWG